MYVGAAQTFIQILSNHVIHNISEYMSNTPFPNDPVIFSVSTCQYHSSFRFLSFSPTQIIQKFMESFHHKISLLLRMAKLLMKTKQSVFMMNIYSIKNLALCGKLQHYVYSHLVNTPGKRKNKNRILLWSHQANQISIFLNNFSFTCIWFKLITKELHAKVFELKNDREMQRICVRKSSVHWKSTDFILAKIVRDLPFSESKKSGDFQSPLDVLTSNSFLFADTE